MTQKAVLFSGTVQDNIFFGQSEAADTDETLQQALQLLSLIHIYGDAEAGLCGLAGCVVERRAVDLDGRARRDAEGLDLRGVKLAVFNLVFFCKQENKILLADVDLAVPVVLETIELCIVAPAHEMCIRDRS